jgi:hypothetical protein
MNAVIFTKVLVSLCFGAISNKIQAGKAVKFMNSKISFEFKPNKLMIQKWTNDFVLMGIEVFFIFRKIVLKKKKKSMREFSLMKKKYFLIFSVFNLGMI